MNKLFNFNEKFGVHIELTNKCNLKCPMCLRVNEHNKSKLNSFIKLTELSLNDIKKAFPLNLLNKLKYVEFCGNAGDPIVCKDIFEICQYFINNNIQVILNTNASFRTNEWWSTLGKLFSNTTSYVIFSIDGLKDTNHIYRVNSNWNLIESNFKSFIQNGGNAEWLYIVFKHNQHQINDAHQLALSSGFKHFTLKFSTRFYDSTNFVYENINGKKLKLENTTLEEYTNLKTNKKSQYNFSNCYAKNNNEFFVSCFGEIFPCCWLGSNELLYNTQEKLIKKYNQNMNDYNILHNSFINILSNKLYIEKYINMKIIPKHVQICFKKCFHPYKLSKRIY